MSYLANHLDEAAKGEREAEYIATPVEQNVGC